MVDLFTLLPLVYTWLRVHMAACTVITRSHGLQPRNHHYTDTSRATVASNTLVVTTSLLGIALAVSSGWRLCAFDHWEIEFFDVDAKLIIRYSYCSVWEAPSRSLSTYGLLIVSV